MITVFDLQKIIMACVKMRLVRILLKREINLVIISQILKKIRKKQTKAQFKF